MALHELLGGCGRTLVPCEAREVEDGRALVVVLMVALKELAELLVVARRSVDRLADLPLLNRLTQQRLQLLLVLRLMGRAAEPPHVGDHPG